MPAVLTIGYHDGTFDEIELGGAAKAYLRVMPEGLMIRWEGVRGNRCVYPWAAVRNYHIETEVGQRDRERINEERRAERFSNEYVTWKSGCPVGRCGHVHVEADPGVRGAAGDAAGGPG